VYVDVGHAVVRDRDSPEDSLDYFPLGLGRAFLNCLRKSAHQLERLDRRHAWRRGGEFPAALFFGDLLEGAVPELSLAEGVAAHLEDAFRP
jgi:hypothetical protein